MQSGCLRRLYKQLQKREVKGKGKIHPIECTVPENSKDNANRGKPQNRKDQRSIQENQRYQGNISYIDGSDERNGKELLITEAEEIKK